MSRKLILIILSLCALIGINACNSSSEEYTYDQSTSVLVSAFKLQANSKVLDSLQNVFFSIDQINARIFNADSLPYGTQTNKLVVSITAPSSAQAVQLEYPREGKTDSLVNYLTSPGDSIDFSNGPVKLRVKSESGTVERVYQINVNVHQVKPDTLAWYQIESIQLPSSFSVIEYQATACLDGTFYCLTSSNGNYCLAKTDNPADPQWDMSVITLPFNANVESLRSSADSMYILDDNGQMYASVDCETWTNTGQNLHYIYGGYENRILGCVEQNGKWEIVSYPTGEMIDMPEGFPVSGVSLPATYDLATADGPQMVMVGGRAADNSLIDSAWGYDGESWIKLSRRGLGLKLEDMTLVAYNLFDVPSSTWTPVQYPALLAFGGRNDIGATNRKVYMSADWGMTWHLADDLLQFPQSMPALYRSFAFVFSTTMHVSRSQEWTMLPVRALHPGTEFVEMPLSRATAPITEWECPAIYMFGGHLADGDVANTLWRGVILRYTFIPKQ